MPRILLPLVLFCVVLPVVKVQPINQCYIGSPTNFMKWVDESGSIIFPEYRDKQNIVSEKLEDSDEVGSSDSITFDSDESDESSEESDHWKQLTNLTSCSINAAHKILKCVGEDIQYLPPPHLANATNFKQYIVLHAKLAPIPPSSFKGLSIGDLFIENSNLSFISDDIFQGITYLKTLTISGNSITTLSDINSIFKNIPSLKAVHLESNQLRNLNCYSDDDVEYLKNLELLSLAQNPLVSVNFQCFKDTSLIYLNLKGVEVDDKQVSSMGLNSLPKTLSTIDLSYCTITEKALDIVLYMLGDHNITTLSLASLKLPAIPVDSLKYLRNSLQFLSLNGNNFNDNSFYAKMKPSIQFDKLKGLDLRSCQIETINVKLLNHFPNVEKLTLGSNRIHHIESFLFTFSPSLDYLDMSNNSGIMTFSFAIKPPLPGVHPLPKPRPRLPILVPKPIPLAAANADSSLKTVILSHNTFNSSQDWMQYNKTFLHLKNVETLALCDVTIKVEHINILSSLNNLKSLDVSYSVKHNTKLISAFQSSFAYLGNLKELYFVNNYFDFDNNTLKIFAPLKSLSFLNLSKNSISTLHGNIFYNVTMLKTLILQENSIVSWNSRIFSDKNQIQNIDLSDNQITLITNIMIKDFKNLKSLNLKSNPLICDENTNNVICGGAKNKSKLQMVDWQEYTCLDLIHHEYLSYNDSSTCLRSQNVPGISNPTNASSSILSILIVISVIAMLITVAVVTKLNWWYIRHYIILARKSSRCALLGKDSDSHMTNYVYDVFVSYSDIDRAWVLDYLVPNIEKQSSMHVCFHERDFQVGLSILENIVECMAKSRCLLMVISESFVKSKWCQFEMHLAQHHAVETKKEQLVMVLLENIPKNTRPKTLHHLMCTRTYLLWPQQDKGDATELFWKRLHRAIKQDTIDNSTYITV